MLLGRGSRVNILYYGFFGWSPCVGSLLIFNLDRVVMESFWEHNSAEGGSVALEHFFSRGVWEARPGRCQC